MFAGACGTWLLHDIHLNANLCNTRNIELESAGRCPVWHIAWLVHGLRSAAVTRVL